MYIGAQKHIQGMHTLHHETNSSYKAYLCQSKIDKHAFTMMKVVEEIAWFYVTVNNIQLVQVLERREQLSRINTNIF
jgi:hypothetical protein